MSASVAIRHRLGSLDLDVAFESHGRLTALFGPSGCGKTSIVNIIAGLLRPDSARITIGGDVLADTAMGIWQPPHRRGIGYVFQDARLFPHLSVRQNLSYGRWFTPRDSRYADPASIIRMLGVETLLDRRPSQLSGGERQRVAIGRALLQSPRLVLMDEPLASLDEQRKQEVFPYIERLRDEAGIPIIYVSHSAEEVARLATDIVLMERGRAIAAGPASDLMFGLSGSDSTLHREAATLLAMTVLSYDPDSDLSILGGDAGTAMVAGPVAANGASVRLRIKASDVTLATEEPRGLSALNIFAGTITEIVPHGRSSAAVRMKVGETHIVASLTQHSVKRLGLKAGLDAFAIVKAMSIATPTSDPSATPGTG